jgi:hypothetical protein
MDGDSGRSFSGTEGPLQTSFDNVSLVTLISGYRLLSADGFGAIVAWFSLVWLTNIYMSLFRLLRLAIKALGNKAKILEANAKLAEYQLPPHLKGDQ